MKKNNVDNNIPSEGEEIIMQFLEDRSLKYKWNEKMPPLKGDSKAFRKYDFYLPKFKIYIEFLGMWNVGETYKAEYHEKKKVYEDNGVPCVYLYPENLGVLEQILHMRIEDELIKYNMRKELVKFKHYQLGKEFDKIVLLFFAFGAFLFLWITRNIDAEWAWRTRASIVTIIGFAFILSLIGVFVGIFYYLKLLFGKLD